MATTLASQRLSIDITAVVTGALVSVKKIRDTEQSHKEAQFQQAVASGMSYADQLKFRQSQLKEEEASDFKDPVYVDTLKTSIATTQKLARYEKVRNKYKDALSSYVTGKSGIDDYVSTLSDTMEGVTDPDLRTEIRGLIDSAQKERAQNELNAVQNRALLAEKDRSQSLIDTSISEIQSKRMIASINKNDDEVATWDMTLLSLKSAKSKLQIEDGLNEIAFQVNRNALKANDKLGLLNSYVGSSDSSAPVTYDGVTYPSLKAYWENKRNDYATNGYLAEIQKEMDADTMRIASSQQFGQIPVARISAVNDFYKGLQSIPEFAPLADQIENQRVASVTKMSNDLYTSLVDEANQSQDFAKAERAIIGVESKFGIQIARPAFDTEVASGKTIAEKTSADLTKISVTPADTSAAPGGYSVKAGDTLSKIAAANSTSVEALLDANPKYKANPNVINVGDNIILPGKVTEPVAPVSPASTEKPTTPAPAPKPAAPKVDNNPAQMIPLPNRTPAPASSNNPTSPSPVTPTPTPQAPAGQLDSTQIAQLDAASKRIKAGAASDVDRSNVDYATKRKGYKFIE